jgi:hypothetical protein
MVWDGWWLMIWRNMLSKAVKFEYWGKLCENQHETLELQVLKRTVFLETLLLGFHATFRGANIRL